MSLLSRIKVALYVLKHPVEVCQSIELGASAGYAMDVERITRCSRGVSDHADYCISAGNGGCTYGWKYGRDIAKVAQDTDKNIKSIFK